MAFPRSNVERSFSIRVSPTDLPDQLTELIEIRFVRVCCDAQFANADVEFLRSFKWILKGKDRSIDSHHNSYPLIQSILVLLEVFDVFHQTTLDVLIEQKLGEQVELLSKVLIGEVHLEIDIRSSNGQERDTLRLCS